MLPNLKLLVEYVSGGSRAAPCFERQPSKFWLKAFSFFIINLSIYLVLAALDLCCCTWAFSSCRAQASLCGAFSCCGL